MSYSAAVSRIAQIQSDASSVQTAFAPRAAPSATRLRHRCKHQLRPTLTGARPNERSRPRAGRFGGSPREPQPVWEWNGTGAPLTPTAQGMLTSGQQQFAARLAADTG